MGRNRTGSSYEKPKGSGQYWYAFLLNSGKKWVRRVPPRPDGRPITAADAAAYKDEVLRRYAAGLWDPEAPPPAPPPPVPTVAERAAAWAEGLTHLTAYNERRIVKQHIVPSALGPMPVDRVEATDVAAWVRELRAKAAPRGGTLAPGTVRGIFHVLDKMFAHARFEKLLTTDPCELPGGILPDAGDKSPEAREDWPYTREEAQRLVSDRSIPEDRRVLYALLFLTGVRCGEVQVLRWKHYAPERDPLGGMIVARARNARLKIEKGTKTGAVRKVPVHPVLAAVLAEWKLSGWARHSGKGRAPGPEDYLVPTRTGKPRNGRNVYGQLKADCERLGIRPRRVHGTRYTFISMGVDDGARWDVFQQLTHMKPRRGRGASWGYRQEAWPTYCAEVSKIRFVRAVDELPLWKAASGGGGGGDVESDNATGNATTSMNNEENRLQRGAFSQSPASARLSGEVEETPENKVVRIGSWPGLSTIRGGTTPSGGDSTTASSATPSIGPHTGEAFAQLWFDYALLHDPEHAPGAAALPSPGEGGEP